MMKFVMYLMIIPLIELSEAYKILLVYPFPANSHNILGNGVLRHLLKAGHEVTYITPFPLTESHVNLYQIDVSSAKNAFPVDNVNIYKLMHKEVEFDDDSTVFLSIFKLSEAVVRSENVQKLLNDPTQHFDIVVAEYMFNELYSGFAAVYNCPYIWILPYEPYINVLNLIDGPPNPAYVANAISDNIPPFGFIQRFIELLSSMKSVMLKTFYHIPVEKQVYQEVFGPIVTIHGRSLPPFEDLIYNASMILGNTHVSNGVPLQTPQSYKSIAGFFIEENVKPLPDDLQRFMDNAKEGVIYFSLGSNLKSKYLPDVIKKDMLKMFGERKEAVLWKFEDELKDLPTNLVIKKWAPQQSILAHPNCKLFITHGGLLSVTESVHFGVPFIGVPVFVDQFNNVNRMVQKGSALRVDISYSLADDLNKTIQEMISNHRYTERAKEVAMIYHDRLVSPGAELVHWVEHVVRTRGAAHLRSPALYLTWYQKTFLDLAGVIILVLILIKMTVKHVISNCLFKKKTKTQKKKN